MTCNTVNVLSFRANAGINWNSTVIISPHCFNVVDLYSGLIADYVSEDLFVKGWGKLREPLASNCSSRLTAHIYNVKKVTLPRRKPFSDTQDHSKWCVTSDGSLTCIADMNREKSQMDRGGGAICTDDPVVGKAFRALIFQYEPCTQSNSEREL